jgi:polar amino acid transport system permease protein
MAYRFEWSVLWEYRGLLLDGLFVTIQLSLLGFAFSLLLSIVVGVARSSNRRLPWLLATIFVEYFRNVPLVVHLFYFYFAVGLPSFTASVVALVLYSSAFMGEVIRSGIQAIPKTQYEAARSSGLSTFQIVGHVVVPQAVMIVIPPLATELVNLIKNSSLAMTIAVRELTFMTQEIDSITFRGFEAISAATLIYVALCFSIISLLNVFERIIKIEKKVI